MPKYLYKAIDEKGNETSGALEAETEGAALDAIHRLGLYPTNVRKAGITDALFSRFQEERAQRQQEETRKLEDARKKHTRILLVVGFRDGRRERGVTFALNPRDAGFYLDLANEDGATTGKTLNVRFSELKAVFYVKSFDGKFSRSRQYRELSPEGPPLVAEFFDGEIIKGTALHPFSPDEPRFTLVPEELNNNISILVERAALKGLYSPDEYRQRKEAEARQQIENQGGTDLSQEETLADFQSEARNYEQAYELYRAALRKFPSSMRLRKKVVYTQYNIGIQYIKRRDYMQALRWMEEVLKADPRNSHAQKKVLQLRKVVERAAHPRGDDVGGERHDFD